MPPTRFRPGRSRRGLAPLSLALALLWGVPALAGDKAATAEGADALKALIAKYLPAAQAGASLGSVSMARNKIPPEMPFLVRLFLAAEDFSTASLACQGQALEFVYGARSCFPPSGG